jgi:Replication protein
VPGEGPSVKSQAARQEAIRCREKIIGRLDEEEEDVLANRLRNCGARIKLHCANCGGTKEVEKGCRQKWCPVCVRRIAAKRSARYAAAVAMMEWPLFITLTVPHTEESYLDQLRRLKRAFGKLRHTKLWKTRTVGGVAGVEINSRSGEFHPHLHAVIDCRWLAWYVRPPQRGDSKAEITRKCRAASEELGLTWAKCLKIKSIDPEWCGVIFKVKRCAKETITSEILKYSIKGTELASYAKPIGPVIKALQVTRLVTSFGTLFAGKRFAIETEKPPRPCECCGVEAWISDWEVEGAVRRARENVGRR